MINRWFFYDKNAGRAVNYEEENGIVYTTEFLDIPAPIAWEDLLDQYETWIQSHEGVVLEMVTEDDSTYPYFTGRRQCSAEEVDRFYELQAERTAEEVAAQEARLEAARRLLREAGELE